MASTQPRDNFATTGQESFSLEDGKSAPTQVVLNIEEDPSGLITLDRSKRRSRDALTGNLFADWLHSVSRFFQEHSRVTLQAKSTFFHLLSVMINAGVPMVRALRSLAIQGKKSQRLQLIIEDLANSVEDGGSFSESMAAYDEVFTEQEIGMVQAGEASGQLSSVLDRLAIDTEKIYSITHKVRSALMYPIVVFSLLVVVVIGMMVYVVPRLTQLFEAVGGELPLLTKIIIAISDFLVEHTLLLFVGLCVVGVFSVLFRKTDMGRYFFDMVKIRLPVFGELFKKAYLSRFARSISNLIDSRISIVRTLEITAQSMGNEVYRRKVMLAREDIKQGIPLAESLAESELFPPMLVNMVEVGEKTAQLDTIMEKVARFYEDEVDTTVAGISKLIEPVVLIVIGVTVGLVVAAIMLPIMKLSSVVTGV